MKRRITLGAAVLVMVELLLTAALPAGAQTWERIALGGGGVVRDVQTITVNGQDMIWAACANSGIFRATWNTAALNYNDWAEHMPGKGFSGLDVITYFPPGVAQQTEAVIGAANGPWYASSTNGTFNPKWDRPNGELAYPDDWDFAATEGAAFYCQENGSFPADPQTQYLVKLAYDLYVNQQLIARYGIYRWRGQPYYDFKRVDALPNDPGRTLSGLVRDKANPNILYTFGTDGIYRIYGPYHKLIFEKLPEGTRLEDLNIQPNTVSPSDLPPFPPSLKK